MFHFSKALLLHSCLISVVCAGQWKQTVYLSKTSTSLQTMFRLYNLTNDRAIIKLELERDRLGLTHATHSFFLLSNLTLDVSVMPSQTREGLKVYNPIGVPIRNAFETVENRAGAASSDPDCQPSETETACCSKDAGGHSVHRIGVDPTQYHCYLSQGFQTANVFQGNLE
eukprot:gene15664-4714_t